MEPRVPPPRRSRGRLAGHVRGRGSRRRPPPRGREGASARPRPRRRPRSLGRRAARAVARGPASPAPGLAAARPESPAPPWRRVARRRHRPAVGGGGRHLRRRHPAAPRRRLAGPRRPAGPGRRRSSSFRSACRCGSSAARGTRSCRSNRPVRTRPRRVAPATPSPSRWSRASATSSSSTRAAPPGPPSGTPSTPFHRGDHAHRPDRLRSPARPQGRARPLPAPAGRDGARRRTAPRPARGGGVGSGLRPAPHAQEAPPRAGAARRGGGRARERLDDEPARSASLRGRGGLVLLNAWSAELEEAARSWDRASAFGTVSTDHAAIGRVQGEQVLRLARGGPVLCVTGPRRSSAAQERLEALRATVGTGAEIVDAEAGEWTEAAGIMAFGDWYRVFKSRNPSLAAVAAQSDELAVGVGSAIRALADAAHRAALARREAPRRRRLPGLRAAARRRRHAGRERRHAPQHRARPRPAPPLLDGGPAASRCAPSPRRVPIPRRERLRRPTARGRSVLAFD